MFYVNLDYLRYGKHGKSRANKYRDSKTEAKVYGSTEYVATNDIASVVEIRYADEGLILHLSSMTSTATIQIESNTVLYLTRVFTETDSVTGEEIVWVETKIDETEDIYYGRFDMTKTFSDVESGYTVPKAPTMIKGEGRTSSESVSQSESPISENGMNYYGHIRITKYGCEPYANGGYSTDAMGNYLPDVVGYTVACNKLPLGTRIYIDGVGERVVTDRGTNHIDLLVESESNLGADLGYRDVWIIN